MQTHKCNVFCLESICNNMGSVFNHLHFFNILNHPRSSYTGQAEEILSIHLNVNPTPAPPHSFQYSSSARGLRGQAVKCFISWYGTCRWQQPWPWRDCMTVTKKAWVIWRELVSGLQLAPGPSSEGDTADISSCESPPDPACVQHNSCGLAALREVPPPCFLPRVNVALRNTQDSKAAKRQMATWPSC